jgi:hypothetical protein
MGRFRLFGVALILSTGLTSPVFAQAAIQEPGAYAFYHPDGDLLHARSGQPAPGALAMAIPPDGRIVRHGRYAMAHRAVAKRSNRFDLR